MPTKSMKCPFAHFVQEMKKGKPKVKSEQAVEAMKEQVIQDHHPMLDKFPDRLY